MTSLRNTRTRYVVRFIHLVDLIDCKTEIIIAYIY